MVQNSWIQHFYEAPQPPKEEPKVTECEFRDCLGLECEVTIDLEKEPRNYYDPAPYSGVAEIIEKELGEFPEDEFQKLVEENKQLDEKLLNNLA